MADENDDLFRMTPAAINETVKAVRDFLHSPAGEKDFKKLKSHASVAFGGRDQKNGPLIAEFLGWNIHRVEESLAELSDIEDDVVEKEVIERIIGPDLVKRSIANRFLKPHEIVLVYLQYVPSSDKTNRWPRSNSSLPNDFTESHRSYFCYNVQLALVSDS